MIIGGYHRLRVAIASSPEAKADALARTAGWRLRKAARRMQLSVAWIPERALAAAGRRQAEEAAELLQRIGRMDGLPEEPRIAAVEGVLALNRSDIHKAGRSIQGTQARGLVAELANFEGDAGRLVALINGGSRLPDTAEAERLLADLRQSLEQRKAVEAEVRASFDDAMANLDTTAARAPVTDV